jgi:hypothetical protein
MADVGQMGQIAGSGLHIVVRIRIEMAIRKPQ